ncbi:TetR/AcrR family transcriptional regulator [Fusobacterium sp.]|uniref:TetR/AcrR family transcriptional regulator n=1 Tax=Fusobacterium sp. TaxID=68766 RepID=UPI0025C6CF1D|nr:TetR/AcrR family transcriptional regulator [Fusobacterium sp.]
MTQKNKSMIARFKILQVALNEFANYSYENSSINRICSEGNISKGVMYHHFKDKDELYLLCIRYCYDVMTSYYKENLISSDNWKEEIKSFFEIRYNFFRENPMLKRIFFNTLLRMPKHLEKEIKRITKSLDELNYNFSMKILQKIKIRYGLKPEEIIFLLDVVQNMLNEKFHKRMEEENDISLEYEKTAEKWIDIILYGICERD